MSALVSTEWLFQHLHEVKLLDSSWHMPAEGRDAQAEFAAEHIPGAQFFDIDSLSDQSSPYPHMLPGETEFTAAMNALGISNQDAVVVYDTKGIFSAPRVWWMFRVFGHEKVSVLDGGLPKWKAEGREVSRYLKTHAKNLDSSFATLIQSDGMYAAKLQPHLLRTFEQVQANVENSKEQVIDARSSARFKGEAPEPRPGLRSGHIPGSINVPFGELLMPPYQTMRSLPELQAIFMQAGAKENMQLVTSCGSGVTACILTLALYEIGLQNVAVYDGSWAEWGART